MTSPLVAPSLLSADFGKAGEAVALIDRAGAGLVHLDVMDGNFVPNITFGHKLISDVRRLSKLPFDVHLMTTHPERHIADFAKAGADYITFHMEACVHAHRTLCEITAQGKGAGIAIVPSTPASALKEVLSIAQIVLVMTVNPGAGGQALIPSTLEKVRALAAVRKEKGYSFLISVDGGINAQTAASALSAGADILVAGSAFFQSEDKRSFVNALLSSSFKTA